jgi:hypothetical protein
MSALEHATDMANDIFDGDMTGVKLTSVSKPREGDYWRAGRCCRD